MNKKVLISCVCTLGLLIGLGAVYSRHTPKISVIMPTHNRAASLSKAIDSIIGQSFGDWELIVINDGSSDKTADILKEYAAKENRIRVLTNKENKGLAYSLNLGIDKAKGEFIARMDDDDISLPNRLAKQYVFMQKHPDVAVTSSFVGNPQTKKSWPIQEKLKSDDMKAELFLGLAPISNSSLFVRRGFLNKHKIRYNDAYKATENIKFYLDLYDAGAVMGKVPEVLLLYHLHQSDPQQWNEAQWVNAKQFMQKDIFPRFNIHAQVTDAPYCGQLRQMIETNKTKSILPQAALERGVELKCPRNPVVHPFWNDAFVFDGSRVCRLNAPNECGSIQSKSGNEFMMKWDRWGLETFVQKDGVWYKKETASVVPAKKVPSQSELKTKPTRAASSTKKNSSNKQKKK